MDLEHFIQETRDYLNGHLGTFARGDLHVLPRIGQDDLLHYLQTLHGGFSRYRFLRFLERLKHRRVVLDTKDSSVTFDPTFVF